MDLNQIATRVASKQEFLNSEDYGKLLDNFVGLLMDADRSLEKIRDQAPSPEGKVIVTGLHQDLFQLICDQRNWIRRLRFMSRSV
jgi:hypothetical protein